MAIEQTTNAGNKALHLVLLGMSKAFDSIKRKDLTEHFQHTIAADEIHVTKKMLEVSLVVLIGDSISEQFHTDSGAPRGDCARANSFTYYLAKSLEVQTPDAIIHDHHYHHQSITRETQNHLDIQSKTKLERNEPFLVLEAENLAIENYNDWVRTIKRYFNI